MEYRPTIGLEIHAELKTQTKMFCDSKNDPDEKQPNVNICPICLAHPGTLPTINKAAVQHILRLGLAVGGTLADFTEFDRKNYFYPDLPKGYQISQYEYPLVKGGTLAGVRLTRIHLEEDTARSMHEEGEYSLVDFNRAGIPLMELVTEPVVHSAEEASAFAKELQLLLRILGAGEANMEKGQMRVEANISVSAEEKLGTKVEVKNLNSFRAVERAIAFEIHRHTELLERGEKVIQETRGWDEGRQETYAQRLKEESHDYRYFPEPDLPKLYIKEVPEFGEEALRTQMPELPWERRARYLSFDLKQEDVEILLQDKILQYLFEELVKQEPRSKEYIKLGVNYLVSDILGLLNSSSQEKISQLTPVGFNTLISLIHEGKLSSRAGKDILQVLFKEGGDPATLAEERGLFKITGEQALTEIVDEVIAENKKVVEEYQKGKKTSLMFLIGKAMQKSKGAGDPTLLQNLFKARIGD